MNWTEIIQQLGGGPAGVGLAAMGFVCWRLLRRNDDLVDKIITMGQEQSSALNDLTRAIERQGGAQ